MSREQGDRFEGITVIHIQLEDRVIALEDGRGTVARVDFGALPVRLTSERCPTNRLPDFIPASAAIETPITPILSTRGVSVSELDAAHTLPVERGEATEQPAPVTLVGQLTGPRESQTDPADDVLRVRSRLAVQEAGASRPRIYVVTFEREVAEQMLRLPRETPLIVEGHFQPSAQPDHPETFAVHRIVAQPSRHRRRGP